MGVWSIDLDSSTVDSSFNDVSVVGPFGYGGFVVFQFWSHPVETLSSFLFHDNRIKATGGYEDGIWVLDFGPVNEAGKMGDFVISDNEITVEPSENGPAYAGVEAAFTEGTIISNNRIVGSSLMGIAVGGASQCMVKANNVEKVTAEWAAIGLLTLNIGTDEKPILVPTSDSTVVGFGNKTNVYADPEAYGNILVGVNSMQGNPPGPAIRDAMKRKMEMIKSMRKF